MTEKTTILEEALKASVPKDIPKAIADAFHTQTRELLEEINDEQV